MIGTFCISSNSILSNSTADANWPLDKARKRNGGYFPGRHAFEKTHLLLLRMGRTKAFPLPMLPRGLVDDRTTPELLSAPLGLLTGAVPGSPMALLCHTTGKPVWAAQVPPARSYSSLALQRCWSVKKHSYLPPGAAPGKLQLSEVCGLSRSSVNVLACMSHRARRTGHLKLAHLMVLAALKIELYNAVIFQPELLKDAWAFFHSATFAAHPHPNINSLAALRGSDAHSTLLTTLRLWLIDVGCGVYQSRS